MFVLRSCHGRYLRGGFENGIFVRLDGTTGKAKDQWQLPQDCQPYGLAIDSQGYGWSPNLGAGPLCYFDTRNNQNVGKVRDPQFGPMEGYGITLDRDQNVWVGFSVHRYTPDRTNGFKNLGNGWWTKFNMNGVGIAADSRTAKKYFVWSADGGSNVTRIPASDTPIPKQDMTVPNNGWLTINMPAYGVGEWIAPRAPESWRHAIRSDHYFLHRRSPEADWTRLAVTTTNLFVTACTGWWLARWLMALGFDVRPLRAAQVTPRAGSRAPRGADGRRPANDRPTDRSADR